MKKTLLILTAATTLFACQKEPLIEKAEQTESIQRSVSATITVNHDMLEFESMDDFLETITELDAERASNIASFETAWGNLNEQQYNDKIQTTGFDENATLIDFEDDYSYTSLRSVIETDLAAWADDPNSTLADCPELDYFTHSASVRTLLNAYGEVLIDNTINVFTEDGIYIIGNSDFDISDDIRLGIYNHNSAVDPHVLLLSTYSCSSVHKNDASHTIGGYTFVWYTSGATIGVTSLSNGVYTTEFDALNSVHINTKKYNASTGKHEKWYTHIQRNSQKFTWYEHTCNGAAHTYNVGSGYTKTNVTNIGFHSASSFNPLKTDNTTTSNGGAYYFPNHNFTFYPY